VLEFDSRREWQTYIPQVFESVTRHCQIKTNNTCSTHIHVSPGHGGHWTLEELKEICLAIVYFEGAFLALLPPHRRDNYYCRSNTAAIWKAGIWEDGMTVQEC
jgi:putative amidoligase enzyme